MKRGKYKNDWIDIFRSRRELRGTVGCVCKYMMYRACLFLWIMSVYEKIVCNFESIKIIKIEIGPCARSDW